MGYRRPPCPGRLVTLGSRGRASRTRVLCKISLEMAPLLKKRKKKV